ncbi:MAG: septum formation initiator [Pseudonocardiaceae bacterium]
MTAPARTSTPARGRTAASGRRRDAMPTRGRDSGPPPRRSPAVARAYARRAQRAGAHRAGPDSVKAGRAPFVLLVMVLLGAALVATLGLSTAATADSYQLQSARKDARNLTERSESLGRQVATLETAPELARRARKLGMVPAGDVARLVVRPDGGVVLVGQPRRATAPAPPPAVTPAPPEAVVTAPPPVAPAPAPVPTPPDRT